MNAKQITRRVYGTVLPRAGDVFTLRQKKVPDWKIRHRAHSRGMLILALDKHLQRAGLGRPYIKRKHLGHIGYRVPSCSIDLALRVLESQSVLEMEVSSSDLICL